MARTRKPIFTINGTVVGHEGKHSFLPNSPRYLRQCLSEVPVGKKLSVVFEEEVSARSAQQLAYHFVLIGYLAKHCGYTKDEMHDAVVRMKFGTHAVSVGGRTVEVRRSVSERAKMPMADMVELVDFDLELCREMGVVVPSARELGYISNH